MPSTSRSFKITVIIFGVYIFLAMLSGGLFQGAVLVKNLAAKEPSVLSLDTYYKQYYLCLASAAAAIKW